LADGTLQPVDLTRDDYRRAGELVLVYENLPLGTTDATVIAVCERLRLTEVASSTATTSASSVPGTSNG
jgi:predicted nucleic acid-binding protein